MSVSILRHADCGEVGWLEAPTTNGSQLDVQICQDLPRITSEKHANDSRPWTFCESQSKTKTGGHCPKRFLSIPWSKVVACLPHPGDSPSCSLRLEIGLASPWMCFLRLVRKAGTPSKKLAQKLQAAQLHIQILPDFILSQVAAKHSGSQRWHDIPALLAALPRSCQWLPRPELGRTPITALQAPQLLVHAGDAPGGHILGSKSGRESLQNHGKSWENIGKSQESFNFFPFDGVQTSWGKPRTGKLIFWWQRQMVVERVYRGGFYMSHTNWTHSQNCEWYWMIMNDLPIYHDNHW